MKKFFSLLMSVAVLFSVTSCSQEDITSSITDGNEVLVTLTTTLASVDTRAVYGNGDNVDKLIYNVYDAQNGDLLTNLSGTAPATTPGKFTVQLKMLKGMKYNFVFWAQNKDCEAYTVNEDKTVKVDYTKISANDDTADAFFGYVPNFDPVTATSTTFKLYRPFAQLNAATTDYDVLTDSGVTNLTSTVTLKTYNTFDISTGDVTGNVVDVVFKEATAIPTVDFHKPGYTYLSMNYVLAAKNQNITNTHFTFAGKKSGNDVVIAGTSYANIPLQQNYRTNILGALLTKTTDFTVEIVPAFDNTEHDVDAVNVSNTIQLLNAINNAVDGHSTVINLDNDIDLNTSRTRAVDSGLEIPAGKVIVLNLNGYILSYENNNAGASMIYNLGTLTIGDSSESNTGHLVFTTTATDASLITNEGALKIDGDTFDSTETIENVGNATVEAVGGTFTDLSYLTSISNGADVTINLEEYVTIANAIAISAANANVTINGNGNTITYTGSDRVIDVRKEGVGTNLTINNLIVNVTSGYSERGINYNTNGQLNLNNVTVQGAGITYAVNLPGMSDNAVVTINNSNLAGCIALNVWGEKTTINVTNSEIVSVDTNSEEDYSAIVLNNDLTTIADGSVVTVVGGSIIAKNENDIKSIAVCDNTYTSVVNISDETTVVGDVLQSIGIITYGNDLSTFHSTFELQDGISSAISNKGTFRLVRDVAVNKIFTINGNLTIDLNGKTLSCTSDRFLRIENTGNEVINVTIQNGTIINTAASGRCIETRSGNINLVLDNVNVIAEKGSSQSFTVGGSGENISVEINNSTIQAGNSGYAVITFNPANIGINNSTVLGYGALYFKGPTSSLGSAGTEVNIANSTIASVNSTPVHSSNSFSSIIFETDDITVNADANSTLIAESVSNAQYIFGIGNSIHAPVKDINVTVTGTLSCIGKGKSYILGRGAEQNTLDDITIKVPVKYTDDLTQLGYIVSEADVNGLITITGIE